jgi:hypothetical protein
VMVGVVGGVCVGLVCGGVCVLCGCLLGLVGGVGWDGVGVLLGWVWVGVLFGCGLFVWWGVFGVGGWWVCGVGVLVFCGLVVLGVGVVW